MKRILLFLFFIFAGTGLSVAQVQPSKSSIRKGEGVLCQVQVTMSSNVTICSGKSATVTATGSGTTGGIYTYAWTPTATLSNPNISNPVATPTASPTTYTCLVTDQNSCTNTGTVTVTLNPLPTASVSASTTICNGSSTTLNGSGSGGTAPYTYAWSPTTGLSSSTAANPTASPTTLTTYTLTVTDSKACASAIATVTVTVNPLPTASVSASTTICNGSSTTLNGSGSGGTAPYTYAWSPTTGLSSSTAANPTASPTTLTTYTLTVTDSKACASATATVSVTVNPLPLADAGSNTTICNGSSTTLGGSPSGSGGTAPYTYAWSPTTGLSSSTVANPTANPASTTTYVLTVTDSKACASATATVVVTVNQLPAAHAGNDKTICNGDIVAIGASPSATGGASPYTYSWSPATGLSSATDANPNAGPVITTTYVLTVTDSKACASASDTMVVTVNQLPTADAGGDKTICNGGSVGIGGSPSGSGGAAPYTYAWSPTTGLSSSTVANPTANPANTTTYVLTVTDSKACASATDSVIVTVNQLPIADAGSNRTICFGDTVTIGGSPSGSAGTAPYTYAWSPAGGLSAVTDANPNASPTAFTTYTLTVTDSKACASATSTVSITVNPLPVANAGPNVSMCPGSSTTLNGSGNGSFLWSPATGLSCTTCTSPTASYTSTITYTLAVTNSCGTAISTVTVTTPALPSVNAGPDQTICLGGSTTIVTSGSGTFTWTPATALNCTSCPNPVASPTVSTNYTITINDICGSAQDSVWIRVGNPVAALSGKPQICIGKSDTLTAVGNGTYSWSAGGQTTSSIVVNPTVQTGYTVTVTDAYGCKATDTLTVKVNPLPVPVITADTNICAGIRDTLVATGGVGYLWSTGGSSDTLIVNPTLSTGYTVTVTDANGCVKDTNTFITVRPQPTALAGPGSTICYGKSTTISGTGNGTYSWSPGNQNTSPVTVTPSVTTTYTFAVTNSCGTAYDSVKVTVNPLPVPVIAGDTNICAGINDTLIASGGVIYVWSTNATTDTLIVNPVLSAGYTVTVTDANGCVKDTSTFITVRPQPVATAGPGVTICYGDSAVISGTGNGTYSWSPGNQSSSPVTVRPTVTTTYTFAVTNSCGTAYDSVKVAVNPLPVPLISGASVICLGNSNTLCASGGTGYSWVSGPTTACIVVSPVSATGYTVTVTDGNGCKKDTNITVNVTSVSPSITGVNAICSGDSSTLTASGGTSYSWNPGGQTDTSIVVSPPVTSVYTVTAFNSIGCSKTATFTVNVTPQPTASVTATTSNVCFGSSATLNASGGSNYVWSPATGLSNPNISNPVATPTSSSLYTVTYTVIVSNGACADTASIPVTFRPLPTATLTATSTSICQGGCTSLSVSGSPGSTYSWSPGAQTGSVITDCPSVTTMYTVTASANGCSSSSTTQITVMPPIALSVSADTSVCFGTTVLLTAQGNGTLYSWSPGGQTTPAVSVTPSVTTTYTVTLSNGICPAETASVTVTVFPLPTADASAISSLISLGLQTTLVGSTSTGSYTWSPADGLSCTDCPSPVANPTATTTYTLCVSDANQCNACDTALVEVTSDQCEKSIFVPSAFSPNSDGHNDVLCVRGSGSNGGGPCSASPCIKTIDFSVFNRWGQKVFYTTDINVGWDGAVDGKPADSAVFFYILKLQLITGKEITLQGNVSLVR